MSLPQEGLIVSCYLHSMKGCEKTFIEVLWDMPEVKTMRIEGFENLALARRLKDVKDKYVIGLVKDADAEANRQLYITATIDAVKRVLDCGVDMVAIDSRILLHRVTLLEQLYEVPIKAGLPIMADVSSEAEGLISHNLGASIIATTFASKVFILAEALVKHNINVNVEGGLVNLYDIRAAIDTGAKWYTIGRAIHDPPTIIRNLSYGERRPKNVLCVSLGHDDNKVQIRRDKHNAQTNN